MFWVLSSMCCDMCCMLMRCLVTTTWLHLTPYVSGNITISRRAIRYVVPIEWRHSVSMDDKTLIIMENYEKMFDVWTSTEPGVDNIFRRYDIYTHSVNKVRVKYIYIYIYMKCGAGNYRVHLVAGKYQLLMKIQGLSLHRVSSMRLLCSHPAT